MPDEKKISSAPSPITPLRGGRSGPIRTPATAPKWAYWPASRHVVPWQAVALSLNFQPWADSPQNFYPHIFPDADTETKFKSRYDLMLACLRSGNAMLLSDFATWAVSVNLELPPELAAMAQKAGEPTTAKHGKAGIGADKSPTSRAHVSDKLAKLEQAAAKFWANADRSDKTTHPKNATVIAWLEKQGFSPTLADRAATIIRPEWASIGRKPE